MDALFLGFAVDVWPDCVAALTRHSDEDTITRTIVSRVDRHDIARRCLRQEFHFEPFDYTDSGAAISKGQIDIAVYVGDSREIYLAYECKRLNVIRSDVRRAQATEYVAQGVMRFIKEQYSENLPVGCMLGYVMDGDLSFAHERIEAAMMVKDHELGRQRPLKMESPIGLAQRFVTKHTRGGKWIEIRHALLPFTEGAP